MEKQSDDTSSDDCTRKAVDYRKERGEKNIYKEKNSFGWTRNPILYSVWIKDLPMLYYSIQFSTGNRLDIVIHDIDPIRFDVIEIEM